MLFPPCPRGVISLNFKETEECLKYCIKERAFPSVQACVGNRDGDLFRWEQLQSSDPGSPLFDLASLTKLLSTAMSTLRLMDRRELSLDNSLYSYFEQVPQDKAGITVRQLLTHTGGFKPHWMLEESCHDSDDVIDDIFTRPLDSRPGDNVTYSCMGYIVLGKILEKITGLPLDKLAGELVFTPLGMSQTGYLPIKNDPTEKSALPTEWNERFNGHLIGVVHDENARFMGGISGNAGLFSQVDDVSRFAHMLLNRGEDFLKPETFALLTGNHTPGMETFRGLGVEIKKEGRPWPAGPLLSFGSYGHTGFTGTSLYMDPKRELFFILLTNRVYYGRDLEQVPRFRALYHQSVLEDLQLL